MKSLSDLSRRHFLKGAGSTVAVIGSGLGSLGTARSFPSASSRPPLTSSYQGGSGGARVVARDGRIHAETSSLTAVIDKGLLTSLKSRLTGDEFIVPVNPAATTALSLLYPSAETVAISEQRFGRTTVRQVSDTRAEVVLHNWDGDGVIAVSVDPESGDLIIEPSSYSSRPGVRACRWWLEGLRQDLRLVVPFYQGVNMSLEDHLIHDSRWEWPKAWEAGFAILQSAKAGFWVHAQDNRYRYKALKVGRKESPRCLGFDTEAYGPIDGNLAAGGLAWRVNVFEGDWKVPAARYRDWLWDAYHLLRAQQTRQEWIHQVRLALSWCPTNPELLDALAAQVDPGKILLHFYDWRSDPYDENYPTYIVGDAARQFFSKGKEMGFHVMPHCNSIDMDPIHPVYEQVRDFQYRTIEERKLWGWSWVDRRSVGVPESNTGRQEHRQHKVMVKIHPGLSLWRSILAEQVQEAQADLGFDTVFLDVTLNTGNLHNSLVEGITTSEGMNRLIHEIGSLGDGLVVGGEGLNETTFSGVSFGQVHLFRGGPSNLDDLARTGNCALNDFLFGKITRTFGYNGLGGRDEGEQLRMRVHEEHGAIPTITVRSAEEITHPNPAVERVLDLAQG